MNILLILSNIIIAVSIIIVWVFRFDNIINEFKQYGLPDIMRNTVGAMKISLSTLLIVSIWYPELATIPSFLMAFLMVCAQYAHFSVKNPIKKYLPSLFLLSLSLFVGLSSIDLL